MKAGWKMAAVSMALSALLVPCGVQRAAAQSDDAAAETVLRQAVTHWLDEVPPRRIRYVIAFRAVRNGKPVLNHYDAWFDFSLNLAKVDRFSREQKARPDFPPGGVNVVIGGSVSNGVVGSGSQATSSTGTAVMLSRPPSSDFLGYPDLAPRYIFGLARARAVQIHDENVGSLQVIGRTSASMRNYDVSFAADQSKTGPYHLVMTPLKDPDKNRVRELVIDRDSFAIDSITTKGNFSDGPPLGAMWTTEYQTIDGVTYLKNEQCETELNDGHNGRFSNVEISFDDIDIHPTGPAPLLLFLPPGEHELREPN